MTFLSSSNVQAAMSQSPLSQRGRSGLEFLGALQSYSSGTLRSLARKEFEADPDAQEFIRTHPKKPDDLSWRQQLNRVKAVAEKHPEYLYERFCQRWVAEEVWRRSIPAVEARRPVYEQYIRQIPGKVVGTLELDPDLKMPSYYEGVEWHLEIGGWDGYDLYGPLFALAIGPLVFRHGGYAAVGPGDNIIQQRLDFLGQLPRKHYGRIYEPGCGGFSTLACAHQLFPDAELIGCDLSPTLLKMGHVTANRLGVTAHFKQRDARDTREPDDSVDAVVMYALLHEMPPPVARELLREMFRIMKPGADLVNSDPPPFRAVDPLQAVILDWDTDHREEPFFNAACSADWGAELRAIGFVDVEEYGIGQGNYPWIVRARKPS